MSTKDIESKVRELRELQALIDEAQAEAELLRDAIKAHMGNTEELRAGEYVIRWQTIKSDRLDTKALKTARPEIYEAFTRSTTTRRFSVA